jgi:hypothetical protein
MRNFQAGQAAIEKQASKKYSLSWLSRDEKDPLKFRLTGTFPKRIRT